MSTWKFNEDDKIVGYYWGDEGWTYILRTPEGQEYRISREQIIKNNYPLEKFDISVYDIYPKRHYAKTIYKNIYMKK